MKQPKQRSTYSLRLALLSTGSLAILLLSAVGMPEGWLSWHSLSHAKSATGNAAQVAEGKKLFGTLTCGVCHSVDGSKKMGPTVKGIFGQKVKLTNGKTIVRDAAYIRTQLYTPKALVVAGYNPLMPSYKGKLDAKGLAAITAYIRSLKAPKKAKAAPRKAPKAAPRTAPKKAAPKKAAPTPRRGAALPPKQTKGVLALGQHHYNLNCAFCHGLQGRANAPGGRAIPFAPKDFSTGKLLYGNDAKAIFGVITNGSPRTKLMPAWKHLPKRVRWAIATYVVSLHK